ncbi:MAG: hypothetical protein JJU00_11540 [Opitutales bacterium]|nr:hypothetical protein [Opitutales bacterium]
MRIRLPLLCGRPLLSILPLAAAPALPLSAQADDGNEHWDGRFGHPGRLQQAATVVNSRLYMGGNFRGPGGEQYQIAVWDGSEWSITGPGHMNINHLFRAIAVQGERIYVGGNFTAIGDFDHPYLAFWDGTSWNAPGAELSGQVNVLFPTEVGIYVGGAFGSIGGSTARNIALWTGASWELLVHGGDTPGNAIGVGGAVSAITGGPSELIVGGQFSVAGGLTGANRIARWNRTTNEWGRLGPGFNSTVHSLTGHSQYLFASGTFSRLDAWPNDEIEMHQLSRWSWTGEGWQPVARDGYTNIGSIHASPSRLYAYGQFENEEGPYRFGMWTGTLWEPVGGADTDASAQALVGEGENIYARVESTADGLYLRGIGMWDGQRWHPLVQTLGSQAAASAVDDFAYGAGKVYAVGNFSSVGARAHRFTGDAQAIAEWDGQTWRPLPPPDSTVHAVAHMGGDVYVGGRFSSLGDTPAYRIGRWDGASWHVVGDPSFSTNIEAVTALLADGSDLYAGGVFSELDGKAIFGVGRWDGHDWHALGSGLHVGGAGAGIFDMIRSRDRLYVVGGFISGTFDTAEATNVAVFDGESWSALGSGVGTRFGPPRAIAAYGDDIIVGGDFEEAGQVAAANLARWDGESWHEFGGGANGSVNALLAAGEYLYAAGDFSVIGGIEAQGVARWDGTAWHPLGTGLISLHGPAARQVNALLGTREGLFVGGSFASSGRKLANNLALWRDFAFDDSAPFDRSLVESFYGPVAVLNDRIVRSGWLGSFHVAGFDAANRWIYSFEQAAWWWAGTATGGRASWNHDPDLGWIWTGETVYPDIFSHELGWLRFGESGIASRAFYRFEAPAGWTEIQRGG